MNLSGQGLGHPGVPQLKTRGSTRSSMTVAGHKGKPVLSLIYPGETRKELEQFLISLGSRAGRDVGWSSA